MFLPQPQRMLINVDTDTMPEAFKLSLTHTHMSSTCEISHPALAQNNFQIEYPAYSQLGLAKLILLDYLPIMIKVFTKVGIEIVKIGIFLQVIVCAMFCRRNFSQQKKLKQSLGSFGNFSWLSYSPPPLKASVEAAGKCVHCGFLSLIKIPKNH